MKSKATAMVALAILMLALLRGISQSWQASAGSLAPVTPFPETPSAAPTLLPHPARAQQQAAMDQVFPVQASATAITSTAIITAFADAEVIQGYPTANCAGALEMHAGYDTNLAPAGEIVRSLLRFHLVGIRPGAAVSSATLWVYMNGSYDYPGNSLAIIPYRITTPWYVDTVNWNNSPSFGEAYTATWITHGAWGWYPFDVTPLVRGWANGTIPNYGLALRSSEVEEGWRSFATSETTQPPRLVVVYAQDPEFVPTAVPDSLTLSSGARSASLIYLTALGGFTESVTLTVGGLLAFTTAQWQANPVRPTASTWLSVTTSSNTPSGTYTLTITGTARSQIHTVTIGLQVQQPDFTLMSAPPLRAVTAGESAAYTASLTATDGFTRGVSLEVGGLPAHASAVWQTNPITPTASAALTVTTMTETPAGSYTLTITGTAGSLVHTATVTLQVSSASILNFELTAAPLLRAVKAGESAAYTAFLTATGGFTHGVWLAVGGLPSNASIAWQTNPITPTASTALTVTTVTGTPSGSYTLVMTGTENGLRHSVTMVLSVTSSVTRTVYLPVVLKNYATPNSRAAAAVSKVALIIGIADYEYMQPVTSTRAGAPDYDPEYTDDDADDAINELQSEGGCGGALLALRPAYLSPDGTCTCLLLLDSQASKAAIHSAIVNWLDPLEDENTAVVIFFSGHGMYAPDDNGDENDPYDEFIVPHEIERDEAQSRWRHEMAIRDDELAQWLSVLESQHVVVILDSCFSGGMIDVRSSQSARGLGPKPPAPEAMTAALWRDGFAQDIEGPGRVVLAASAEEQSSWEFGALKNGVFTYYLLEAMTSPSADTNGNGWISAEEAFAYAASRVDNYVWTHTGTHQNPQMSDGVSGEVDLTHPGAPVGLCPTWD